MIPPNKDIETANVGLDTSVGRESARLSCSNPTLHVDWVLSPYMDLIAWVFLHCGFPSKSKIKHVFLFPIHNVIGAHIAFGCVVKT